MPLTRLDLSGSLCIEEGCSKIVFNDTTGSVDAACADDVNELGYGLVGGIASTDVTGVILNVYYPGVSTPFIFTFIVATGTITSCILTDLNGNDTDITADLVSTDFPLVDFQTNLAAYGVDFPETNDGIIEWDYTISGEVDREVFSYTTSGGQLIDCKAKCCIEKSYLDIDANCDCSNNKIDAIIKSEIFFSAAHYAVHVGQEDKSNNLIKAALDVCTTNCKTC
jgi:hypothetical protein